MAIHQSKTTASYKIYLTIAIEGAPCRMEVDTGSSKSLISWDTLKKLVPTITKRTLQTCQVQLQDYQGNHIPIFVCTKLLVEYKSFTGSLPLIIVNGHLSSLLGLDWFGTLGLGITGIHSTTSDHFEDVRTKFAEVFNDELGKYNGSLISLNLDPQVAPIRLKPRRVPFALRPLVEKEVDK